MTISRYGSNGNNPLSSHPDDIGWAVCLLLLLHYIRQLSMYPSGTVLVIIHLSCLRFSFREISFLFKSQILFLINAFNPWLFPVYHLHLLQLLARQTTERIFLNSIKSSPWITFIRPYISIGMHSSDNNYIIDRERKLIYKA